MWELHFINQDNDLECVRNVSSINLADNKITYTYSVYGQEFTKTLDLTEEMEYSFYLTIDNICKIKL